MVILEMFYSPDPELVALKIRKFYCHERKLANAQQRVVIGEGSMIVRLGMPHV